MFHKIKRRIPVWCKKWGGLTAGTIIHYVGSMDEDDLEDMALVAHVVQFDAYGKNTFGMRYLGDMVSSGGYGADMKYEKVPYHISDGISGFTWKSWEDWLRPRP